ncbi:MAG: hypothetical protein JKP90_10345 [Desulfofustis sp. PB-SRB1]|nr:hypothetical protein [Desulfofustis sp. PB-SRB1]
MLLGLSRLLSGLSQENRGDGSQQVTHETIRSYQLLVMDMDIAEETKGMRLRPVKRLFGWLLDTHRLLLDPTENIRETSRQNRTVRRC